MIDNLRFAADGAWQVLAIGLLLGAGLPLIFALGIRSLAWGSGGEAVSHAAGETPASHPLGRVLAAVCFGLVVLAIVLGITIIVSSGFGKEVSFEHLFPTIVDKE